jgi:large subunit ribosomal protein L6
VLYLRAVETSKTIQIPDDTEVTVKGRSVTVKGKKGTLTRSFSYAPVSIEKKDNNIRIWTEWPRKKETAIVGTVHSHIQNIIKGVSEGFTYKLKIVFSHFPISVKINNNIVLINNFIGERNPRKARIIGDTKIKVKSEDLIVQGLILEDVSQTAANIQQATRVRRKDPRVFLDGIYVYEKSEGFVE